ncbi:hypothetical protein [Parvicella tangerina]|uniref:Uncharacterized protein n=1 Tax=Parvicella tangerina TaxID=2829795 RepID=A0A916JPF6_9FLAO|nr:hypothetical protein [Parvicella tangerina]CAG5086126.1 hypothetical protein CRYO30217_03017 [Parvicella tangerina]
MKALYITLLIGLPMLFFGQAEVQEITWEDLRVESFEATGDEPSEFDSHIPKFTEEQSALDGKEVILSGNYHVLNNFGSKSYLLSRDEIIKTPMQGDEVVRLIMEEDPEIYFGRTAKIKGVLHIDENIDAETIYYITDVKKVKNTGTVVEE